MYLNPCSSSRALLACEVSLHKLTCDEWGIIEYLIILAFINRLVKIKEWIDKNDPGASLIPFSGVLEHKLVDMPDDEREAYLKEVGTTR
jgi:hypothetical protein